MTKQSLWSYAIIGTLITICTSGFARMSYGILMPFMKESLSISYKASGILATATALGYLLMVLFVGIMAAKFGSKILVIIGLFILSSGFIVLFFVQSYISTLIAMIILGVGTAFSYTPLVNIIVGWFPQHKGLMIGFLLSGMGLGTLITSMMIPLFNTWFLADGWRYLWLTYGVISIIVTFISIIFIKDTPIPLHKDDNKDNLFKEVYFHPKILIVAVIYGFIGFAYLIPQSFLFSYILKSGINQYTAGTIMGIGGFLGVFSGPVWGAISDKIGRVKTLSIVLFIISISVIIPITFPTTIGFITSQILWGLTMTGMLSLTQALSVEQIKPTYAPIALGYVTIFFASGQILGPSLGGIVIDLSDSIAAALWLCFSIFFISFILTIRIKERT